MSNKIPLMIVINFLVYAEFSLGVCNITEIKVDCINAASKWINYCKKISGLEKIGAWSTSPSPAEYNETIKVFNVPKCSNTTFYCNDTCVDLSDGASKLLCDPSSCGSLLYETVTNSYNAITDTINDTMTDIINNTNDDETDPYKKWLPVIITASCLSAVVIGGVLGTFAYKKCYKAETPRVENEEGYSRTPNN